MSIHEKIEAITAFGELKITRDWVTFRAYNKDFAGHSCGGATSIITKKRLIRSIDYIYQKVVL